jgi:glycerophosphoryl diester phosphodiesterase
VGTDGFHGTAAELDALSTSSLVRPTENLIEKAQSLGYTVVYTEKQLYDLLDQPVLPTKVLGVFAPIHTFNDRPEEVLAEAGLPLYLQTAPTIGEMLEVTQQLMEAHPNFNNGSIAIVEEEGTDNFGNNNNTPGMLEALRRTDAMIGVAMGFVEKHPNTLIITAADSDAGGLQVRDPLEEGNAGTINNNPIDDTSDRNVPMDGQNGVDSPVYTSAPDADGDTSNLAVAWSGLPDFSGSIVSKAHGLNADKLPATLDNTKIYELMYETLFEVELESRNELEPTLAPQSTANMGNVIFIHPDGTSPSHYMALRNIDLGPDGRLNWDQMSHAGVYLGHMDNQLTGTSNAGAVTHANGVKVFNESFGLNEDQSLVTPASGKVGYTILEEAIEAGKATALIQSGHIGEPGTAAFAAATTNRDGDNIRARDKTAEIAEQVIRSGTDVIMAGGEVYLLPQGTTGFHVTPEIDAAFDDPADRPSTNLIELAKSLGYTVVYTEKQMNKVVGSANPPSKLLGVFAANHTFDDRNEESLGLNTDEPLPLYVPTAPTVAEMLEATLKIVNKDADGFFVVVEEEGTDNFGNDNNAVGTIEAMRRADAAIGVAMDYVDSQDPNTLVLTAADSDAGGLQVYQFAPYNRASGNFDESNPNLADSQPEVPFINVNRTTTNDSRVYLDGEKGSTGSTEAPWVPFSAKNSIDGPMGNFGIAWVGTPDFPGSIVAKTYGMNAELLPTTLDNTEIYKIMYQTLFGIPAEVAAENQVPELQTGTPGADLLISEPNAPVGFDGINDRVFTGAGNDEVDVPAGGANTGFNRIDAGSGKDTVYGADGDRIFGGSADDLLDVKEASAYRLSGGDGDDLFYLGANGRAIGGKGNDQFYVGEGGDNLLSGGAGADQFWLLTDNILNSANTVVDFSQGEDVIGIANQGAGVNFDSLTLDGNSIALQGNVFAIFSNFDTTTLTAADFVFL